MQLSYPQLMLLAEWESIHPGFDRDGHATHVQPIVDALRALPGAHLHVVADGGLSNYAAVFLHNQPRVHGELSGVYVYLSLLAPIAVLGRGTAHITDMSWGYDTIEPTDVLDVHDLTSDFERSVWAVMSGSEYDMLSRADACAPLPVGVVPYEYCLNSPPWDRAFHVLFSDTD